ncbi:MAG: rRNA biogenesis protein rrp5 [Faecalispora jeddahensis]
MSKMKLLLDVVSDLRSLADSLQAVADAVAQGGQEQPDQTTEEQPVQKPEKKTAAKKKESSTEEEGQQSKPLSLEQVRAALAEKSRAGHTSEVKALLIKHGADKLSDIEPAEYPALLAEAEVL